MARNKLSDLADLLFAQLEDISEFGNLDTENMTAEQLEETKERLKMTIQASTASKGLADSILEISRLQLEGLRLKCEYHLDDKSLPHTMALEHNA